MKMYIPEHWIKRLLGLVLGALLARSASGDTPAFTSGGSYANPPPRSFSGTRGWAFRNRGTNAIVITAVGIFDDGGDGLANSHEVGIWTYLNGQLLDSPAASATVLAGTEAPLTDGYRYAQLSPVILPPQSFGVIAGAYGEGDADDLVHPRFLDFNSPVYIQTGTVGRWAPGPGLPTPGAYGLSPCEGCGSEVWYEPNFKFEIIPEPHVSTFLGLGLVAWVLLRRKNGNRTGSPAESQSHSASPDEPGANP